MFEARCDGAGHPRGWPLAIHVCGQYEVRQLGFGCGLTHLLSIKSSKARLFSLTGLPSDRHMILDFEDTLDASHPDGPRAEHVERVCDWVDGFERDARLVIHCLQGLNRSTAVALGVLARGLSPQAAGAALHNIRPMASPNMLVTSQWDEALGWGGALTAVAARFPCRVWSDS